MLRAIPLCLLLFLTGPAQGAPLPEPLRWFESYRGLRQATQPSDPPGQNDFYISGEPAQVYRVVTTQFAKQGWTLRERQGLPVWTGRGKSTQKILGYCGFTRGPQRFDVQVTIAANGFKMLSVIWRNWQPDTPSPSEDGQ